MCLVTEEQAIKLAKEFLKKDGEKIIKLVGVVYISKEKLEREFNQPFKNGTYYFEFSVVLPPDAKFVEDEILTVRVNDVTGKTGYSYSL